jgi:hypothetical protein
MKIRITIPAAGNPVTIKAVDLTGATWHDYGYYLAEAERANAAGDAVATNRALRAALINLFAHLEGVVAGLHSGLVRAGSDFMPTKRSDRRYCTLKDQVNDLCNYAERRMNRRLDPPRMHYKLLRDIVVHPSITKTAWDFEANKEVDLSEVDLFELSVDGLRDEGKRFDKWLDQVCSSYGFSRFHDTYGLCKNFADPLTGGSEEPREM